MPDPSQNPLDEILLDFTKERIEYKVDLSTRLLYSTDASIYQIEPLGVVFPKSADELTAAVALAARYAIPVLARGSGSSLAGQAIGTALILDCSRYLNRILDIDQEEMTATVEPGVILNSLNRQAGKYQLQFGPDPASAERASLGGSIANNATGAHSIVYGMAADHILSSETILGDGSLATFKEVDLVEATRRADSQTGIEGALYRTCLEIREEFAGAIQNSWPRTWRRASGYSLNYLLPWSPSAPPEWYADLPYPPMKPGTLNLSTLLAGSEGTLGVIRKATLRLVPLPRFTVLGVLSFNSLVEACDATPTILEQKPSAIELIPQSIIRLARSVPAYAPQLGFVDQLSPEGDPPALLVIEFSGDDPRKLKEKAQALHGFGESHPVLLAETAPEQKRVWGIRKMGLGILASRPGDIKSISMIEDIAVPVEKLGEFVRGMEQIFAEYATEGDFYAHASAGCLHIRPLLNIKTAEGVKAMRLIATQAVDLAVKLQGAVSGEHGIGIARAEWLPKMYGEQVMHAFRLVKQAADPKGILNPGKILDAPPMDTHLRYGAGYKPTAWQTGLDFSQQGGLVGAIELCNGAGVCRKSEGVMCPSFQATQDEMHSTRGRANLLRAMLSGMFPDSSQGEKTVYEAIDLCLACKGCKAECPSAVDMAKLRYEFLHHYYTHHRHRLRDTLFGRIDFFARLGYMFRPIANPILKWQLTHQIAERWMGISAKRTLPVIRSRSLSELVKADRSLTNGTAHAVRNDRLVLFLSDAFTEYFYPETGLAALRVIRAAGYTPVLLPILGAGRTLISKGFIDQARQRAQHLLKAIERSDPQLTAPVVGVEPSEILSLRDEYRDLLPDDRRIAYLAERAFMIDEFLIRPGVDGKKRVRTLNLAPDAKAQKVILHGHCYQKAQPPAADGYATGVGATVEMLKAAGFQVEVVDSGCCGMAGAFGYESEHYETSMKVGELGLLPALRQARAKDENVVVAASGVSCQAQIEDGVGDAPHHPISLVYQRLRET